MAIVRDAYAKLIDPALRRIWLDNFKHADDCVCGDCIRDLVKAALLRGQQSVQSKKQD
jgi:hypothetical protein